MALEQIGQKLRAARETQGLSLQQIHERTKIPVAHLQSIESACLDDLPEPVYVAGFIKRYADCLGLNGQMFSAEYRKQSEPQNGNGHHPIWGKQHHQAAAPYATAEYVHRARSERQTPTFKTIYFNAIWVVVVIGLVSYLSVVQMNNQANQLDPSLAALRDSAGKYSAALTTPTEATPGTAVVQKEGDTKVTLSASQHVWVEVKSVGSGESLFTGYMEQGERRDFQDPQGLRVRAGNGGSLSIDFQGKTSSFGEAGKVCERTFANNPVTAQTDGQKDAKTTATTAGTATKAGAKRFSGTRGSDASEARGSRWIARETRYRRIEDSPSRQYMPGESLGGGTRSIDVPYRYTEGRLDAE